MPKHLTWQVPSAGLAVALTGSGETKVRMKTSWRKTLILCGALIGFAGFSGVVLAETAAGRAPAVATEDAAVAELVKTMRFDQVIDLLRIEGLEYGKSIEDEMFPGGGGAAWSGTVAGIYDVRTMQTAFDAKLAEALRGKGDEVAEMTAFFVSPLGQRVLELELEARRSLMDDDTEAAASLAWSDLAAEGGARVELVERFAEVNDLVETNVMGTLNSNLAFYQGMAGTGAFAGEMTEDTMLSDVWAQEPDIRQQTREWVYPFLNLSYSSLSDEELQDYVDFSESDAGQVLNTALFAAFDAVFVPISRSLGAAAALQMKGQDI